jgi:hypothetical protein
MRADGSTYGVRHVLVHVEDDDAPRVGVREAVQALLVRVGLGACLAVEDRDG